MLKADIQRFENLASPVESVREAAARELQALAPDHFWRHAVGRYRFSPEQLLALQAAWQATGSDAVRAWIAQALVLAETRAELVLPLIAQALRFTDAPYFPAVLTFFGYHYRQVENGKALLKAFHAHPDPVLRERCAHALNLLRGKGELVYAEDIEVLRKLMLDSDESVREQAVRAVADFAQLGPADFEVLLEVENIDSWMARRHARELIDMLARRVPGCTRADFAPRVPLLRHDAVYFAERGELDAKGRWVSLACLRFHPDGMVQAFGLHATAKELPRLLVAAPADAARGSWHQQGGQLAFSVYTDEGGLVSQGRIDGSKLYLSSVQQPSGRRDEDEFRSVHVEWTARGGQPALPARARQRSALPFEPLRARSVGAADAARWYLQMLARLPALLDASRAAEQRLAQAWRLKGELRRIAAQAHADAAQAKEFLARMPLPSLEQVRERAAADAVGDPVAAALKALLTVSGDELRAFPGPPGAALGMAYWDGKRNWVLGEAGWVVQPTLGDARVLSYA